MYGLVAQVPLLDMGFEAFAVLFITALAGGALGAALGALPAFVFTGFLVFLGEGIDILQRAVAGVDGVPADALAVNVTGVIGFGAVTGPHIAFAGGVAASAYAGKKYPEMGPKEGYHFGKDIAYAFGTKPDILAVGAAFGALGMLISQVSSALGVPTDGIALSVFLTAVLARVVFDYPLIGSPAGDGLLDMSPFERGEERVETDGGVERVRPATEPWLPHQYEWAGVTAIGLVGGILGGYIWLETGSIFMGYAISAMSLLFLNLGVEKIPVTHHITLMGSAGAVVAAAAVGSPLVTLLVAGGVGALTGVIGEVTQRVFYSHSGTHVDPPAMAIAVVMFLVGVLYLAGVIPNAGYLGI
ncbi:hypothetical protein [Candidatus Halobonum tyrrellensis]|uniref:DUF7973 domain-containing protein n=1 Tax=Candidatus Halobonum tyrrellensis G22 TaxID=1324957 RepID=V4J3X2_9EURY|nr:hypothetical protein [Candidatus Halobonum tyrrellensis]ESP90077.1 hypothetical protein K933_00902 [Candidatus Halobonum tyrrellensis G22]